MKPKDFIPPRWKSYEDLTPTDKGILEFDSVYGGHLKWSGIHHDLYLTCELVLDRPNRFAIKIIDDDPTTAKMIDSDHFFTKIPGNISCSGRWTENDNKVSVNFYFPTGPDWSFDSLQNDGAVRIINNSTVEINKNAPVIRMLGTPCEKKK